MNQSDVETFVAQFENVQSTDDYGYKFYFVGEDHRLPFISLSDSDNEYDSVSNLNREGVFRINIGVSKKTFAALISATSESIDYSVLDEFLPHPEYARQHFVCILNPSTANEERTKALIREAYTIAVSRLKRVKTE